MTNQQIIEAKVDEFISSNQMFTSVDISNAIKKDGTWISNSEVASFLRRNSAFILSKQYSSSSIPVLNGQKRANLYYPIGSDTFDYQNRDQKALTPQEAGLDPNAVPTSTVTQTQPVSLGSTVSSMGKRIKISASLFDRLRIPAKIVAEIGLEPGDPVDVDSSCIIVNRPLLLSKNLKVHADGRISIPRECVYLNSQNEVYVYSYGNKIHFSLLSK
jgi:hypothetical protein